MRSFRIPLLIVLAAAGVVLLLRSRPGESMAYAAVQPSQPAVILDPQRQTVRVLFGIGDMRARDYSGRMVVTGGSLEEIRGWNPGPQDTVSGSGWQVRSRLPAAGAGGGMNRRGQGRQQRQGSPAAPGIIASVRAGAGSRVEVTTQAGDFNFTLAELPAGRRATFLNGAVAVERLPVYQQLTRTPDEEDYPASAAAADGTVWCAYVGYKHGTPLATTDVEQGRFDTLVPTGNGDQVRLQRFDGREWSAPLEVTGPGLDVWRPTVAIDGAGTVWVVWSQGVAGNWDLYARAYEPKRSAFGRARRLTTDPGPDLNAVSAGSQPSGSRTPAWIAWQGWRGGQFDIWASPLGGEGGGSDFSRSQKVSTSPANDWHPAMSSGPNGDVWIAWDTYDRGNYDVYTRRLAQGRLNPPMAVATSPRFEARPSIQVDRNRRVWIAFEDADPNWGKDYGTRWEGKSGVQFYLERRVFVRCLSDGELRQPAAQVTTQLSNTTYPPGPRQRVAFPRLSLDGDGRLWLLFRRHPLQTGAGEHWISLATCYSVDRWSDQIVVPESENLLDNRPALVPVKGALLAVYSTDHRTGGTASRRPADLMTALLQSPEGLPPADAAPSLLAAAPGSGAPAVDPVHPNETEDIQRARSYRATIGGRRYQLLRGEFHRHTEISSHRDQDGPFEEIWRYGLDVARMDWIGPGDHDAGGGHEYIWWITQKQADMYHQAPVFMPMFTYERSVVFPSGHRNVMMAQRGVRPLPRLAGQDRLMGTPETGSPDIKNLYAYLKRFDGFCSSHTSATNMGTDWRDNDPQVEPVVEIYQGHRQNYEEPKAPMAAKGPEDSIGGYQPAGFVWNAFGKGYRLGFQVSSDHISTHISYGIVYAEKPTRAAIVDAFKKRHSYGAHDNIVLDVRCGDRMMGDEFTLKTRPKLDITVQGTAPVTRVDIVRQVDRNMPTYVYAAQPDKAAVRLSWTDMAAQPGATNMYYVRIMQQNKAMAWASPLWIRYQP